MRDERPSQTALAVCFLRATERLRPEEHRVLDDPFAEAFLDAPYRGLLSAIRLGGRIPDRLLTGLAAFVVLRHRYIDDALLAAAREGLDQVVVLGAGYDSRAMRFAGALGDATVFEVDHPATSARKRRIAEQHAWPSGRVARVAVDFERDDPHVRLREAGFRDGARTFWIWEGVSMYLQRPALRATLDLVRASSAPGSRLAMDLWFLDDDPTWRGTVWRTVPGLLHLVGEPVTFEMHPDDVGGWLGSQGLELVDLARADELVRRYVRDGRRVFRSMYVVTARVAPPTR